MLKRRSDIPGFQEGGANVDPISGNEVPTGSMPEEVRDDIDAKLSPGEFVLPADVVRFIGLERLMKMRDEAKKGLQRMSEIGQMGNADEVGEASNGTYEDAGFESEIDDILSEIEAEENGRDVNEQTEVMMAQGGFMKSGTDLTKAPKNPVFDVRYYKNAEGSVMYITHINGKPMTPIPEGYKAVTQEEAQKVGQKAEEAAKAVQKQPENESSYEGTPGDPGTPEEQAARNQKLNDFLTGVLPAAAKAMIPGAGLMTLAQKAAGLFANQSGKPMPVEERTGVAAQDIRAQDAAATAYQEALNAGISPVDASRAAINAADSVNSGVDPTTAAANAVANAQQAAGLTKGIAEEYAVLSGATPSTASSSRSMAGAGSSFAVSPPSVAATSPVSSTGGGITSRDLDQEVDRSGSYDYGGSSYGYESPSAIGDDVGESYSFLAKGGLVNKRQYPTKKKRGKGIASAKA